MKTFVHINNRTLKSADDVVVIPGFDIGLAAYDYNGERWFVPWEYGEDREGKTYYHLYINRGAIYKEGEYGAPVADDMIEQIRADLTAAFTADGRKWVLH